MERLTARNNFVLDNAINAYEHTADSALDRATLDFLKELREYRKSEEQGLILRLPCKVGTELFAVLDKCRAMVVNEEDCDDELSCLKCPYKKQFVVTSVSATKDVLTDEYFSKVPTYIWGKTLFATPEEAGQALKRMESE